MTRKHYNELAEIIRDNLIEFNSSEGKIIFGDYFKTQLLSFLKRDNSNFQKDRFSQDSGLDLPTQEDLENPEWNSQNNNEPQHISQIIPQALGDSLGAEIGRFGKRL